MILYTQNNQSKPEELPAILSMWDAVFLKETLLSYKIHTNIKQDTSTTEHKLQNMPIPLLNRNGIENGKIIAVSQYIKWTVKFLTNFLNFSQVYTLKN